MDLMTKTTYAKTSPYYSTKQASWFLSNLELRDIPPHTSDRIITIENKHHERPDLLAFDLYGSAEYLWIFMVRNPNVIKDPIYDQTAGKRIFVPTMDRLLSLLSS